MVPSSTSTTPSYTILPFTRRRFATNEEFEVSQRTVRFNEPELRRIAAEAAGSMACVDVSYFPDSLYNKACLLTTDDGVQVVAKLPYEVSGPPHYTVASEVATMEFVGVSTR